jgi:hypothetical protein
MTFQKNMSKVVSLSPFSWADVLSLLKLWHILHANQFLLQGPVGHFFWGGGGAAVKLLTCVQEVMGSSYGNSPLQKCREKLRT